MNDFLRQFLVESRELADEAVRGLLALEHSPNDAEVVDTVFRALHTLKGGAGIVEFPAMERAVHAAESVLADVRAKKLSLTPGLVGNCLRCLDQVAQWLDTLETTGELPIPDEAQIARVVDNLDGAASTAHRTSDRSWVEKALNASSALRNVATVAIRYTPDPDCFFRGEDPFSLVSATPGLLALSLEPVEPWSKLSEFDPHRCNVSFTALANASVVAVTAHLEEQSDSCEIVGIEPTTRSGVGSLPPAVRDILGAQIALLDAIEATGFAGRVASAGRAAGNALRFCGSAGEAEALQLATAKSLELRNAASLREALSGALATNSTPDAAGPEIAHGVSVAARTVRVDAERIDALVRLTSELTVAKNAVGHIYRTAQTESNSLAPALRDAHGVLDQLVSELQRSVLGIRVLPLRHVLQRFPRAVRELSSTLGKSVDLVIEGDDTEADKAIVEMLFEPLLHIVRNALDHGIENPDARSKSKKSPVARIGIRAFRQADRVLVEVSDDGRGVNVERVREVAILRGIVAEEVVRNMNEADIVDLIFVPGFSTASDVSELSGRGVGMDAVRSAVEKVGGKVSIESRRGDGTTVRLALPFSAMMTQVMTVEAGSQIFGIPLDAVVETVRVPTRDFRRVGAAHAIVLRERTLPVVDLTDMLGIRTDQADESEATLVITAFAGQYSAIRVDRAGERMQVMLKPLDGLLAATPGFVGTTVLGDGRVMLVLDVAEWLL